MVRSLDPATALEIGLAAAVGVLLCGLGVLVIGRVAGGAARGGREREGPPASGRVPDERHQHTAVVSAR